MTSVNSRSINTARNLIVGLLSNIITLLVSFISRTYFIKLLGPEYLGLNGLFTNFLTVLSLAELGIGNVLIYSLFKPLAEKNEIQINRLLQYYRRIYKIIAFCIFILGVFAVPLINFVVNSDLPDINVLTYYLIFLINSSLSYLWIYKSALIKADQRAYILTIILTIFFVIKELTQVTALWYNKSYLIYLVIALFSTFLSNLTVSKIVDRLYPFIKKAPRKMTEKFELFTADLKSAFLYRLGIVLMNNTDNILISCLLGTVYVGYYSNYNLLVTSVSTIISVIVQGLFSSVGNLNAESDSQKSFKVFNTLLLFFHWASAFCAISFFLILNEFIAVWIGAQYQLGISVVSAVAFNFYVQNVINPVWIYRETMGLFGEVKYLMLKASLINIILSIILGFSWGLAGIVVSTAISRILTTVWFEPRLIYNTKFMQPVKLYWCKQFCYFVVTCISFVVCLMICQDFGNSFFYILMKIIIVFVITGTIFVIASYKTDSYRMLRQYTNNILKMLFRRHA